MSDPKKPETELERLKRERDEWHDAWVEQRLATGRAYWQGYEQAQRVMRRLLDDFPYTKKA